jgi:hypothetical protein
MTMNPVQRTAWIAALSLSITACNLNNLDSGGGPSVERTETKDVEKDNAEIVRMEVEMAAGQLTMSGGSDKLMSGTFTYDRDSLKPEVRYEGSSFRGHLTVKQNSETRTMGKMKNEWNLRVSDDVPLDLTVKLGAGEGTLKLGDAALRNVEFNLGAGKCDVDLRGAPKKSYEVKIRGGVGEANVWVPKSVGIIAEAKGGIGEIQVHGLTKDGDSYKNDAYGKSKTTIQLDVKGGIGAIHIYAE